MNMARRQVAASDKTAAQHPTTEGLLQAAQEASSKVVQDILFCGQVISIRPAAARDYHRIYADAQQIEQITGRPVDQQVEAQLAWVVACMAEPRVTLEQAAELSNSVPADFEKLAVVCEHISQGQPMQTFALGALIAHAARMVELAEPGTTEILGAQFWRTVLGVAYQFVAGDSVHVPDFAELGKALQGEGVGVQAALDLARSWAERQEAEAKNASAALSDTGSSEPASDGPTEAPPS